MCPKTGIFETKVPDDTPVLALLQRLKMMEHAPEEAIRAQAKGVVAALRGHYDTAAGSNPAAEGISAAGVAAAFQGCFKDEAICTRPKAKGKKAIENAIAKVAPRFGRPRGFSFAVFVQMACSAAIKMGFEEGLGVEIRILAKELEAGSSGRGAGGAWVRTSKFAAASQGGGAHASSLDGGPPEEGGRGPGVAVSTFVGAE